MAARCWKEPDALATDWRLCSRCGRGCLSYSILGGHPVTGGEKVSIDNVSLARYPSPSTGFIAIGHARTGRVLWRTASVYKATAAQLVVCHRRIAIHSSPHSLIQLQAHQDFQHVLSVSAVYCGTRPSCIRMPGSFQRQALTSPKPARRRRSGQQQHPE